MPFAQAKLLDDVFGGKLANQLIGDECPHRSEREENFYILSVEVSQCEPNLAAPRDATAGESGLVTDQSSVPSTNSAACLVFVARILNTGDHPGRGSMSNSGVWTV